MAQMLAASQQLIRATSTLRNTCSSSRSQTRHQPVLAQQNGFRGGRFGRQQQQQRASSQRTGACRTQGFGMGMGPGGFTVTSEDVQRMMQDFERAFKGSASGDRGSSCSPSSAADLASFAAVPVDVAEETDSYTFTADLPGVARSDTKVQANRDERVLTISGERKAPQLSEEQRQRRRRAERRFGKFKRTFKLPEDADLSAISATFKDGVLAVSIKRTVPAEPEVTNIPIDDYFGGSTSI